MILVDTNVVSEALKPAPSQLVLDWLDVNFDVCALSAISILELEVGVQTLPAGRRRDRLQSAIGLAIDRFRPRILAFDERAARSAAQLCILARSGGRPLHQMPDKLPDLQIAGIALANECPLATRDAADFRGLGIDLIDPWSSS